MYGPELGVRARNNQSHPISNILLPSSTWNHLNIVWAVLRKARRCRNFTGSCFISLPLTSCILLECASWHGTKACSLDVQGCWAVWLWDVVETSGMNLCNQKAVKCIICAWRLQEVSFEKTGALSQRLLSGRWLVFLSRKSTRDYKSLILGTVGLKFMQDDLWLRKLV